MTSFLVASLIIGQKAIQLPISAQQNEKTATSQSRLIRGTAIQSEVWQNVESSLAFLPDGLGKPFGLAVLIDRQGYFLAHSSALVIEPITAKLSNGNNVRLARIGFDRTTQLVLLQAQNWDDLTRTVISVANPDYPATELTMATVDGPVRSTVSQKSIPGIAAINNRYLPLNEVQFESMTAPIGGALIFNRSGELLGVLSATLYRAESPPAQKIGDANRFGPMDLTVGYALSPKTLRRVVSGFLSESHKVQHPNIGILFKDNSNGSGAIITNVTLGMTANKAGLQQGDIITSFDNLPIKNALELATKLFEKDPGESVTFGILRSGVLQEFTVQVDAGDLSELNQKNYNQRTR